jgi:hypothetical protein
MIKCQLIRSALAFTGMNLDTLELIEKSLKTAKIYIELRSLQFLIGCCTRDLEKINSRNM